jgi:hypothetical protein
VDADHDISVGLDVPEIEVITGLDGAGIVFVYETAPLHELSYVPYVCFAKYVTGTEGVCDAV